MLYVPSFLFFLIFLHKNMAFFSYSLYNISYEGFLL